MSTAEQHRITPQEYLQIERRAETKSEFYQGEMFATSGATREHNLITGNVGRRLQEQFDNRDCEVYQHDMRVKVRANGLYTYPDVVVACDQPQFEDDRFDTLLNPIVIVEVLSDSTEGYDRGAKFELYRALHSLRDYILISQDKVHIEHFNKDSDGRWVLWESNNLSDQVRLDTIPCVLNISDIYAKVTFE